MPRRAGGGDAGAALLLLATAVFIGPGYAPFGEIALVLALGLAAAAVMGLAWKTVKGFSRD